MVEIVQKNHIIAETIGRVGGLPMHLALGTLESAFQDPDLEKITRIVQELVEQAVPIEDVLIQVGHDNPLAQLKRLKEAELIHWSLKYTLGLMVTMVGSAISEFIRLDYFNPSTNTLTLYNANPAIARHELGHAEFFNQKKYGEISLVLSFIPILKHFNALYIEFMANKLAISHVPDSEFMETESVLERNISHYIGFTGFKVLGNSLLFYFSVLILGRLISMTDKKISLFDFKKRGAEAPLEPKTEIV